MNTRFFNLMEKMPKMKVLNTTLSLRPFVRFLEEKSADKNNIRAPFFRYVLDRIHSVEGWDGPIDPQHTENFAELFELIYFTLTAPVTDESELMWALGEPLTPRIFFGTEAFYGLLADRMKKMKDHVQFKNFMPDRSVERVKITYALVLSRLYGISYPVNNEIRITIPNGPQGLIKHYRIEFDTRFIDIRAEKPLPEIDVATVQTWQADGTDSLDYLQKHLPLEMVHFEGFSIVHFIDVTPEFAIESIKDIIVNYSSGQKVYSQVIGHLQSLIETQNTFINLFPVLQVNDRLIMNSLEEMDNHMQSMCSRHHFSKEKYLRVIERFIQHPKLVIINDIHSSHLDNEIVPVLELMGIQSLALVPVFFQKQLVGILEIFSTEKDNLTPALLVKIKPAIPLLEQLLQATRHNFEMEIDNVIKNQFTALQPAVHWRFNEAAWHYIQDEAAGRKAVMQQVQFTDVHPLYGAIDIRNSTIERNNALRADMDRQLALLEETLDKLRDGRGMELIDEHYFKARSWRTQIDTYLMPEDEFRLFLFFERDVAPFLELLRQQRPENAAIIDRYLEAVRPEGEAHLNRREMDTALELLNTTIAAELDKMNATLQEVYPCYFEKFRSDGIEYDIYIGQSITPQRPFQHFYLRNLRLLQLSSMAEIARQTQALLPKLPKKLQTTQLIFINANTIDISFRNDERRFDVEGAYNIRYEMMKKRIDKVLIRDSDERLTQPGKIAMVYFQQRDIEEYLSHIQYLQQKEVLLDDLEYLDLEELQGLSGLKALRVGVKY